MLPSSIYTIVSYLACVAASPTGGGLYDRDTLLRPSEDPFYTPPAGFENLAPGAIIRSRAPPNHLAAFSTIPLNIDVDKTRQLLFRTTDSTGNPQAAVSTIIVPQKANFSRVISYQDIPDSPYVNCATSYALQRGSNTKTTLSHTELFFEAALLDRGYVMSLPDYEGPKISSRRGSGQITLDSIRAALNSEKITGIVPSAEVTMWGYSGGSIATEWAVELQPSYAPELKILGAAIGGIIANLSASVESVNKGSYAGFAFSGVIGLTHAYPSLAKFVDEQLIPATRDEFFLPATECATTTLDKLAGKDIGAYFKNGLATLNDPEALSAINDGGIMGLHGLPETPLYLYHAIGDEVSPIATVDALVNRYCAAEIESLEFHRNEIGKHTLEAVTGVSGAMDFLIDRFDGKPVAQGCTIKTGKKLLPDTDELGQSVLTIFALVKSFVGLPIGLA